MLTATRRSFLGSLPLIVAPAVVPTVLTAQSAPDALAAPDGRSGTSRSFPTQDPDLVKEMVTVAHGNFPRVKELVDRQPSLAKAAWDWGFGDWETALGAASHVGSRAVAEYLLAHGAQPVIFSAAMLGDLDVVKAFVAATPGIERTTGPHGLTLAHHARVGADRARGVADYLKTLPGADEALPLQPLADADLVALTGAYVFGPAADERIDITAPKGQLTFARVGHIGRPLFHRGDLAFSPMGADAVRVRFARRGTDVVMTIHDPDVVLTVARSAAGVVTS
jgi:hypothetical protein